MPVDVVNSPDALFAPMLAEVVSANLDYEIAQHAEDGIWAAPVGLGRHVSGGLGTGQEGLDRGGLPMRMLTILKNFGRLEA